MAKHVMVVDDSRTTRDMIAHTLRGAGYQVSTADDGRQALDVLAGTPIDVVITDLSMPVMDGVALIQALRADAKFRALPILMLTTESDPARKNAGRSAGASGWIIKPFHPQKLLEIVDRVCA